MTRLFVTGTDTGVGKTIVSAWLVQAWAAEYWKPVQAGTAEETDTAVLCRLTGIPPERCHSPAYTLAMPASPHAAAAAEGIDISLSAFALPRTQAPLVIEGAGGVLVPLNQRDLMVDLIARLGVPVLLVARSTLGTINHTLLSLEALRRRGVAVVGVVMVGPHHPANRASLAHFGATRIIAELPWLDAVTPDTLRGLPHPPTPEQITPIGTQSHGTFE